jgi:hypothetical protein
VINELEVLPCQQLLILGSIETRVIERVASIAADTLAVRWACVEHQCGSAGGMRRKHCEHLALIVRLEVKETVPGEQTVEGSAERQRAHIGDDPILLGKASSTKRDQCWRGINPGHAQSACYQIRCNRRPSAASQVEDARVLG